MDGIQIQAMELKEHLRAIKKFGITKYHRKTFSPISELLLSF